MLSMPIAPPTSYDELPYPSLCYAQSHPDRLHVCGHLLGLTPAPVTSCRVLELGCASGGNLIPMAYALPNSTFVGVDLSERQIEEAAQAVHALGLQNIAFLAMDIRDISPEFGTFDYIIAHGVYSWVPSDVRDHLLAVCHANLAPHGIAYVSYNTYPGWHMLQALREMMLYHTRSIEDPHERAEQARALIHFLREAVEEEQNQAYGTLLDAYRQLLEKQQDDARPQVDAVLLHDELEAYNDPVYFWEFAQHADRYGLQFLIEADFPMSIPNNLSEAVFRTLQDLCRTVIDTEQYMDFIRNRTFRRTLLCHQDATIDRTLRTARLRTLALSTQAQRLAPGKGDPPGVVRYASPDGALFQTDHPLTIAAMDHLIAEAPHPIFFKDLVARASQDVAPDSAVEPEVTRLAANLLKAFTYSLSLVELHAYVPPFVTTLSERPLASAVARYQARFSDRVANLRHERVRLDTLARFALAHLDGAHTREDLNATLDAMIDEGKIRLKREEAPSLGDTALRARAHEELDATLAWLARAALLVG